MDKIFYDYIKEDLNSAHAKDERFIGTMHFHLHYEVNFVVKGQLSVINNGTSLDCSEPCILLHAPCSFHKVINGDGPYERYKFHFNGDYVKKYSPDLFERSELFRDSLSVIPLTDGVGDAILPVLALFPTGGTSEERNRYFAFLLDLVVRYFDKRLPLETEVANPGKIGYIGGVLSYISENFNEDFTVCDLAKSFYVSKTKLNDDFKAVIGKTIKQHIIDVRISNAMKMLTEGRSVLDTAHDCGFIDESHFIKTFRERVGNSPKKFARGSE